MRIFFAIIIFIIGFQSWTKADDISEFEIEGISIGDSALDFFDKNSLNNPGYLYKNKKYFVYYKKLTDSNYDGIQVSVNQDKIIHSMAGKIYFDNNISECFSLMSNIEKDLDVLFPNAKKIEDNRKHRADPNKKSTIKDKSYFLSNGDAIQISCTDWSKFKHKITGKIVDYTDELKISIYSKQFIDFLNDENY